MFEFQFAVGDGGGDHEGAALDAIGNDAMLAADQLVNAFNANLRRAMAGDLRPHFIEEIGTVHHFRFAGRADENGLSLGQRGGAHDVDGAEDRRALRPAEIHTAAFQAAAHFADNVAVLSAELRAELLQTANVQIDRAIADGAPSGDGNDRLAALGQQRPQHADRGPHRFDDIVAGLAHRFIGDFKIEIAVERGAIAHRCVRFMAEDMATQLTDELGHRVEIGKAGNALQNRLSLGHQAGGEDGECGVFAAGNLDLTLETIPTVNDEAVHFRPSLSLRPD